MMEKLKPCPFCNGNAKIRREKYWQPKIARNVICTNCFANSGWFDTEDEAIEAWNRRASNG